MSAPAMKEARADELEPAINALAQFVQDKLCGSVEVHFNYGVPTVIHRNEVQRIKGVKLDGATRVA